MSILIQTSSGTFVVPTEKEAALVSWLQQNAALAGHTVVKEQTSNPAIRQLINEDKGREF
jgi:hypothetical protein